MTQIPNLQDVEILAADIADSATTAHTATLMVLADAAEAVAMNEGAAQVLRDPTAPEVVRQRAFVIIARNWPKIFAANQQLAFDLAFEELAGQWVEHEDLRHKGDLTQLWASRTKLAELRATVAHHRSSAD